MDSREFLKQLYQLKATEVMPLNTKKTAFLARTDKGKFILKKVNRETTTKRLENMSNIINAAKTAGINCPELIINNQGNLFTETAEGEKYYAYKFIDGGRFDLSNKSAKSACELLTELQTAIKDVKTTATLNILEYASIAIEELREEIEKTNNKEIKKNKEILTETIKETEESIKTIKKAEMTQQPIHGDFQPQNVIFDEEKTAKAIIDFEQTTKGPKTTDLAAMLCTFPLRKNEKEEHYLEYLQIIECIKTYQERTEMSKEAESIYPLMQFFELNQLKSGLKSEEGEQKEKIITKSIQLIKWLKKEKNTIKTITTNKIFK
jgi:Ser/Thr protein kinase RdoA (MazF antagonist)